MILKRLPPQTINNKIFSVLYKGYAQSKNLRLRYTPDGKSILVTGPKVFSQERIDIFLKNSSSWLQAHQPTDFNVRQFMDGTIFPFLGEDLTIQYHSFSRKSILKEGNIFHVMSPSPDFKDQILLWIKKQSKVYFENFCYNFALKMNVTFKSIHVSDSKTQWGSCYSSGRIFLSWRLAFAPLVVSQYVVIHELSHLTEMNHSAAFWKIVSTYDPKYQVHRQWLKRDGITLHQWGSCL